MNVETYECQETAAEPIEASEEAIGIIEQLELEGQKSLISAPEEKPMSRCPYREMKAEERFVFGVHYPEKMNLAKYSLGSIPLRVLQIASHADSLGVFKRLEVWHAKEVAVPDPVLVGIKAGSYSWEDKPFILARWGEVLESWPTLYKQAFEMKRQQLASVLKSLAAKVAALHDDECWSDDELIKLGAEWQPKLEM